MPRLIPPPPRMPRIEELPVELPAEEQTPPSPSGGATVVTAPPESGATVKLGGKRSVHVGTATIVAVIAALAAGMGGRATAASEPGLAEDLRELRKDIRYIRVRVDRIEDRIGRDVRSTSERD